MAAYRTSGGTTYTLQSSISSTQTTITLTSFTVPVSGTAITMAVMGTSIAYATIAPRTNQAEFISFTGVVQNADGTATLTGVTRGLDKNYPYTESSDFKLPHAGATQFILSDAPSVFNEMAALKNDNTWTGRQQFPTAGTASAAVVGSTYVAPVQDIELATKKYVDDTASYGAPFATTTTAGIVQLPTQAQQEAATATGSSTGYLVVPNTGYGARFIAGQASATGSPNTYAVSLTPVPTAYSTGMVIGFIAPNQNTGNATINVNSLGAKNLQLGSTGLFSGAFTTNTVVGAIYNGSSFDIIWQNDGISASATANKIALRNTTGDLTVPSTPTASTDAASRGYVDTYTQKASVGSVSTTTTVVVGFAPALITFDATAGGGASAPAATSHGAYAVTTNSKFAVYTTHNTNGGTSGSGATTTLVGVIQYGSNPTATTLAISNVTSTSFDVTYTAGTTGATFYWSAIP